MNIIEKPFAMSNPGIARLHTHTLLFLRPAKCTRHLAQQRQEQQDEHEQSRERTGTPSDRLKVSRQMLLLRGVRGICHR